MIYTILSVLLAACIGWIAYLLKKRKEMVEKSNKQIGSMEEAHKQEIASTKEVHENSIDTMKSKVSEHLTTIKGKHQDEMEKLRLENEDLRNKTRNRGEILTQLILENLKEDLINKSILKEDEMIILPNIFIPEENGKTRQIDHLVLLPQGLYVIETKNWKGHIVLGMTKRNSGKFSFLPDLLCSSKEETIIFKKESSGISVKTNYGNPITQVAGAAFILSEYLKKKSVRVGWVESIVFFNHDDKTLYDWSTNPKVKRMAEKEELVQFFKTEITGRDRRYSAHQLNEIKDHIEKTNYIAEAMKL
ncbi:nuclease-related domain-containing protein [Peribacillus simplex]|uniref:Nuclease-related domain-containing protein n=2 Tax=Peribacillus TaxID=2675229 RepID=A0AA90P9B6_9BACI|nr:MULTISPECIES: nuclease-related domain-containing protein [Peribacillus]MDP1420109.1 nuclease-related domain-containing protein [Peribacillus simplex]MDP1454726.1 nuclease-related domain-containing protein [Peribacillus frigoritolerans]